MNIKKNYQLIIFDCDGTLVDSETIAGKLITQMFQEIGINISEEETARMFIGTSFSDIRNFIIEQNGALPDFDFEEEYRKRSKILFESDLTPIAGVENILKRLKIDSCVGSNAPHVKMNISLPVCKLDKYFPKDKIFSAYDVQKWKPEPDLFLYACEKMGKTPEQAIVIEDSYPGIMGAVNAQIDVIAYNPHQKEEIKNLGIPEFKTMSEMEQYLEQFDVLN